MLKKIILILSVLFFGCNDNKIDEDIISKGTQTSKENINISDNLDVNSYKDIAIFFKNNQEIIFSKKPTLIIFSANNCIYCEGLKNEIKNNEEIQKILKNQYNSYYINISYHKIHNYQGEKISTEELLKNFNIDSTPTLVFFNSTGKTLLIYPGFMNSKRLILTMNILSDIQNQNLTEDELFKKLFLSYRENNV
ncbi:SoxW family protein [Campylobacter aviculae]|uniref:Thioredoxin n=1 Tax=Campylobacter aviculae TaxID=2510190 RepID=A0A4U7BQK8_9BACT|nr:thioredoxin family protein [Campylobacter aviculae]TKX31206.1 thioredoxin [Campylobacter aviculae]